RTPRARRGRGSSYRAGTPGRGGASGRSAGRVAEEAPKAAGRRQRRRTRAGREIGPAQDQPEAPRRKAS
ncbi:MAG: hypothetical protein ACRDOA_21155, partial [Streptosporangiaceae bacterium]